MEQKERRDSSSAGAACNSSDDVGVDGEDGRRDGAAG